MRGRAAVEEILNPQEPCGLSPEEFNPRGSIVWGWEGQAGGLHLPDCSGLWWPAPPVRDVQRGATSSLVEEEDEGDGVEDGDGEDVGSLGPGVVDEGAHGFPWLGLSRLALGDRPSCWPGLGVFGGAGGLIPPAPVWYRNWQSMVKNVPLLRGGTPS